MKPVSPGRFDELVDQALATLPEVIRVAIQNLEVVVDHETPVGTSRRLLLGLYQGVPLPERGYGFGSAPPDKITIFQKAIEAVCASEHEAEEEVRKTVVHEFGHYFGLSEKEIKKLGY